MQYQGVLNKMQTEYGNPIQYYLAFKNSFIHFNQLLNKEISIQFDGYECLHCGKEKKIFRQGFCFDCFTNSAQVGDWIMRPELSKAHLGIEDRDLVYEQKVQLQPHVVYLAVSSDVKVGVTRKTQIPTRWIDQGASYAVPLVEVPNRYLAGITEVHLKGLFTDKTNWRKMLQNEIMAVDLNEIILKTEKNLPEEIHPYFEETKHEILHLEYPIEHYPSKVSSLNLDKSPFYSGKLIGIKGQYLIFDDNTVFNIRTYEGYKVKISI